ncbi:hypothetical protein BEN30_03600 [Magnetovibrio blakemorei]|uniref:diguanylate cyclase n=2 Tax=Magnetovibrio blakemorei TaxID=28181 RepID=A0A1E5QAY3_9PROT|nr:hypothetical protein BEN30_03600 [Magnetovibrio blakemorei]
MRHLFTEFNVSWDQIHHLIVSTPHSPYLRRHRMTYIIGRVQLVAFAFAIFIPLWSVIDYFTFPWPQWAVLTGMRACSSAMLFALAWPWKIEASPRNAFGMTALMLMGPPIFYLASLPLFAGLELDTLGEISLSLYGLLPYIVLAGLSVFPLTIVECILFGIPVLALTAFGGYMSDTFTWASYIGNLWLALVIFGVSMFAGVSSLRYMIALVSRASLDPLTNTYTRRSGSEIIDMQFRVSARQDAPFAIVFFDLDHFKSINDSYGHDEGDKTLVMFTQNLRDLLRGSDTIVRWGGEEFLVALPNTDVRGARLVVGRIIEKWLGTRPDGTALTASIGVAERKVDSLVDWSDLVELADKRMYVAKETGRKRAVFGENDVLAEGDSYELETA